MKYMASAAYSAAASPSRGGAPQSSSPAAQALARGGTVVGRLEPYWDGRERDGVPPLPPPRRPLDQADACLYDGAYTFVWRSVVGAPAPCNVTVRGGCFALNGDRYQLEYAPRSPVNLSAPPAAQKTHEANIAGRPCFRWNDGSLQTLIGTSTSGALHWNSTSVDAAYCVAEWRRAPTPMVVRRPPGIAARAVAGSRGHSLIAGPLGSAMRAKQRVPIAPSPSARKSPTQLRAPSSTPSPPTNDWRWPRAPGVAPARTHALRVPLTAGVRDQHFGDEWHSNARRAAAPHVHTAARTRSSPSARALSLAEIAESDRPLVLTPRREIGAQRPPHVLARSFAPPSSRERPTEVERLRATMLRQANVILRDSKMKDEALARTQALLQEQAATLEAKEHALSAAHDAIRRLSPPKRATAPPGTHADEARPLHWGILHVWSDGRWVPQAYAIGKSGDLFSVHHQNATETTALQIVTPMAEAMLRVDADAQCFRILRSRDQRSQLDTFDFKTTAAKRHAWIDAFRHCGWATFGTATLGAPHW